MENITSLLNKLEKEVEKKRYESLSSVKGFVWGQKTLRFMLFFCHVILISDIRNVKWIDHSHILLLYFWNFSLVNNVWYGEIPSFCLHSKLSFPLAFVTENNTSSGTDYTEFFSFICDRNPKGLHSYHKVFFLFLPGIGNLSMYPLHHMFRIEHKKTHKSPRGRYSKRKRNSDTVQCLIVFKNKIQNQKQNESYY